MKIRNSLKSAKTRDKNCRVVRRHGRVYVINKKNPRMKARQGYRRAAIPMRGTGLWLAVAIAALAPLPARAAPPRAQVDRLLAMLQAAPDEASARLIEDRLHALWRAAGSPAARMLLDHGVKAIQGNAPDAAAADLDAAVTLDPAYAEAYSDRAAAHLMQGDYAAAIGDAGAALRQEPGHFAALQILSQIAQARGDWKGALEAWQRVLALDPHTPDGQTRLNLLRRNAEGEAT